MQYPVDEGSGHDRTEPANGEGAVDRKTRTSHITFGRQVLKGLVECSPEGRQTIAGLAGAANDR